MERKGLFSNPYFFAVIIMAAASIACWVFIYGSAYNTYNYSEIVSYYFAYNMNYYIHYSNLLPSPLQFLVYGNHIAPDQLLVLLLFSLVESVQTLVVLEIVILSLTALLVFIVVHDLLGNDKVGLLLSFAFIANPGTLGIFATGYSTEMLIMPLYIMAFYFYMKRSRWPFFASLVLLLGTMEEAPFFAMTLAIGLIFYEKTRKPKPQERGRVGFAYAMLGSSLIALLIYALLYHYIAVSYTTGGAFNPYLKVNAYPIVSALGPYQQSAYIGSSGWIGSIQLIPQSQYGIVLFAVALALLAFGIWSLYELLPLVIFIAPWLYEGIVFGRTFLMLPFTTQYFGFVLGGTFAASMLGLLYIKNGKPSVFKKSFIWAFSISLILFFSSIAIFQLANYAYLSLNPGQNIIAAASRLDSVVALVPQNATVMTDGFIVSHLFQRKQLESLLDGQPYFQPEYIVVDSNNSFYIANQNATLANYLSNHSYSVYAKNGSAVLYVKT